MSKKRWFLRGLFPRVVADWEEVGARSIDKGRKKGSSIAGWSYESEENR
jgi:hypothetical protein